ncbi:MAG: NDP-sugar synthase [Armatimonadetes bacterium]|nr:NDP-sugar synthase [Armatimonadota bacterium]
MKAMLLAAGVGSRLDPLTRQLPKPMAPVINRPVMEHLLNLLRLHGFSEVMVNLHYMGGMIKNYFGNGSKWGVKIRYSLEEELWGDAGSVKRCEDFFDETFIVIGADDLTDLDLTKLMKFHTEKRALVTIALSLVEDPSEYGIALLNEKGRITRFLEKPKGELIFSNSANIGMYVCEPDIFNLIPRGTPYGYGKDLLPLLVEQKKPLYGFLTSSYWKDVGSLQTYRQAHLDAMQGRVQMQFPYKERQKYVWVGDNVEIAPDAHVGYPVVIGHGAKIMSGARVEADSVIGENCVIESGAHVEESILWDNAVVMEDTKLVRCIVGEGCRVKSNVAVFDGVIVDPIRRDKK